MVGWFRQYGRVHCLEGSMDVKDMGGNAIKILNEVMIQLSSAYLCVEKDVKDNQSNSNLKMGYPIYREKCNDREGLDTHKVFPTLKLSEESARLILDLWSHIEDSYVRGCQLALKQIRNDSQEIVSYFAQLRNDFKEILKQPDSLCACLIQFQKDFNSIPAILRSNYKIKAELCQKVDDLQVKLWNICDGNKKKIESHINLCCGEYTKHCIFSVNNHLLKLVKLELYKLENISNMLKDVYSYSHDVTYSPSFSHEDAFEKFNINEYLDSNGTKKTVGMFDENCKLKSNTGDDKQQVQNIFELLSFTKKVLDEMDIFGEKPQVDDSSAKKSARTKKSSSNVVNDKEKNDVLNEKYMWMNYLHACMKEEVELTRERMKAIESVAYKFDDGLYSTTNNLLNLVNKWAVKKYLMEMQSIDQVCDMARNSSEYCHPISDLITIRTGEFFMDESFDVPVPFQGNIQTMWMDKTKENLTYCSYFTICQLFGLFHRFVGVSPTGLISKKMFQDMLQQIGNDGGFPERWMNNFSNKIEIISCSSMYDDEFISWRKFILLAVNPIWPKKEDMLRVLSEFRKLDQLSTGYLTKEQFLKTKIWFDKNGVAIKEFLFYLFACHQNIPSLLDYETFLLNFCLDENPVTGVNIALTMASVYQNDTQSFINSCNNTCVNKEIISVQMLYKVLFPLPLVKSQGSRFFNKECRMALIHCIFKDLEAKVINGKLPIEVIKKHPLFQMLTRNSFMFWLNINFNSCIQ